MAKITVENKTDKNLSVLYIGELEDVGKIAYVERDTNALTTISYDESGLDITRLFDSNKTILHLYEEAYGSLQSEYGILPLDVEVLDYQKDEHRIIVEYRVQDTFLFTIEF